MDWANGEWTATFIKIDKKGKRISSMVNAGKTLPNDASLIEPYITLEKYPPVSLRLICNDGTNKVFWPQGNFKFTNIKIINQNKKDITAQSTAKGDYNERLFNERLDGIKCAPHIPTFEPGRYWVDTTHWPSSITLEIPST
jgi:hypothetical protein